MIHIELKNHVKPIFTRFFSSVCQPIINTKDKVIDLQQVPIQEIIDELELELVHGDATHICFSSSDINRPGIQLADFFDHFAKEVAYRLQIIGSMEMLYLQSLSPELRRTRLDKYFSYPLPCVILSRNMSPTPEMLASAQYYSRPLFTSRLVTTRLFHKTFDYLNAKLALRTSLHGVLVDVYGIGILLSGASGIGKSETALELIKRGHRLVSDDAVEIKKVSESRLIGEAPATTVHFMEIRGIGIINVKAMYGIGAITSNKGIDLMVKLQPWEECLDYERLGIDNVFTSILDVAIPTLTIPVSPGRNLSTIVEAAARNFRLKSLGYNAAIELDERIKNQLND